MNMQQMMKQAQKMQRQLEEAQAHLSDVEVSATAGGGMVKVTGTADGDINAMLARAQDVANSQIGAITGGMGMPGMF